MSSPSIRARDGCLTSVGLRAADYLELQIVADGRGKPRVHIFALWAALIDGLAAIWPATRTQFGGVSLGDVWPCDALRPLAAAEGDELVPFHKLTGWMTYSLVEPIQNVMGWTFEGVEHMTGLPEYRNGECFRGGEGDREGR